MSANASTSANTSTSSFTSRDIEVGMRLLEEQSKRIDCLKEIIDIERRYRGPVSALIDVDRIIEALRTTIAQHQASLDDFSVKMTEFMISQAANNDAAEQQEEEVIDNQS